MDYKATLKLFLKEYGRYKKQLIVLVLLGLLSGLLEGIGITALVPLFSRLTGVGEADDVISRAIGVFLGWFNQGFGLKALLPFIIFAFVLKSIILGISRYIPARIGANYEKEVRSFLFGENLNSRWDFIIRQKSGHLETLLIKDASASSGLFLSIGEMFITISSLLMYIVIALSISTTITLLSLALGGAVFLVLKPLLYKTRELSAVMANAFSDMVHHVGENISGLKSVKAGSAETPVTKKGEVYFNIVKEIAVKINLLKIVTAILLEPISIIFVTGVFAFMFISGSFEMGVFAATMYLIHRIFQHIQAVQMLAYKMNERIPYLKRLTDFRENIVSYREGSGGEKPFKLDEGLEFRGVNFFYPGSKKKVLSDFTLRVKKGEMVGVIGESGAGKTTIVDLLLRLLNPTAGQIFADGVDIAEIGMRDWRNNIGYVSQDIFVISDTIEANIRFYDETLGSDDIERGAKMAYIYDFIQTLPQKFNSQVGDRGVLLSGGERQRLVLARYLARYPKILVLDEATSALDNKSELMIQKAIEELKGRITIFVIAHRLSTILNCDKVISLYKGKVQDEGSPEQLFKDKSSYFYKAYNIRNNIN